MGVSMSKYTTPMKEYVTGRKRKHEFYSNDEEMNRIIDDVLRTPKRRKISTSQYIFKTLFREGKNSDVRVLALGESFCLHKVYLCQSPYFASMFGGAWLESTKNVIPIEIVDEQITLDALDIVFGSLYQDDIELPPTKIISVLATGTLFQLESIIDHCTDVMLETINPRTVITYYNAACEYGVQKVKSETFKWLEINLLRYYSDRPSKIKQFNSNLLTDLIKSPDLFVMQTEFSIYILLRSWLFLKINQNSEDSEEDNPEITEKKSVDVGAFFRDREEDIPFLLTQEGRKYAEPFKSLKLKNLLLHHLDIEILFRDNIIPKKWFNPEVLIQWCSMLRIHSNEDSGPKDLSDEEFYENCVRCGRILEESGSNNGTYMWRWTGFHFGLDLVLSADNRGIQIKRNHRHDQASFLSHQSHRNLGVKVTVACTNTQLQIKHLQTSEIMFLTLTKNEEQTLLNFDKEITFPLLVSVNFQLTSPTDFTRRLSKNELEW